MKDARSHARGKKRGNRKKGTFGDEKPSHGHDDEDEAKPKPKVPSDGGAPDPSTSESFRVEGFAPVSPKERAAKLFDSIKMLVKLGAKLRPVETRLSATLDSMPPAAKTKAAAMLGHIKALRGYSAKVLVLLQALKSKDMTGEERKAAIVNLVHGLHEVQMGIKEHVSALRLSRSEFESPGAENDGAMPRMVKLLQLLKAKVDRELADPATKDLPQTHLDLKVFSTMKETVVKLEALAAGAENLSKKAKTEDEKIKLKVAIKMMTKELTDNMKNKFLGFQREAADLASLIQEKGKPGSSSLIQEKGKPGSSSLIQEQGKTSSSNEKSA